ncbi:nitroreductase family protein [Ilumatobacter sp.]|uniref:nitroreductase family protein n=1 Tax=Ilumatobacter sp. TaxID=1967498 RepID=UPI003B52B941
MDVFEAMSTCRAMRYLRPDPVDDELIEQIITAATWAPSPGNSQGRDFVVVRDADKKRRIGDAVEAAMADRVAAMERPDRTHRLMLDGTAHLIETLKTCPVLVLVCGKAVYPYEAPRESFVWSSIYPAAQNLIVAARALGLGTVFTTFHGVAEATIRDTLAIPDDVLIGCLVPVGWPDREFGPLERVGYGGVVHVDGWRGDLRTYPPTHDE